MHTTQAPYADSQDAQSQPLRDGWMSGSISEWMNESPSDTQVDSKTAYAAMFFAGFPGRGQR